MKIKKKNKSRLNKIKKNNKIKMIRLQFGNVKNVNKSITFNKVLNATINIVLMMLNLLKIQRYFSLMQVSSFSKGMIGKNHIIQMKNMNINNLLKEMTV